MSELNKFLFENLPVRGLLVRLETPWQDILSRRAQMGAYPVPVRNLLGEMTAAAALLQANIQFNGALVLQIQGDGPLKLAVVEVQPDLALRATAKIVGAVHEEDDLTQLVNRHGHGRCAITLDPRDRQPDQAPYQGVVSLSTEDEQGAPSLSAVLEHYMRQSEQLETRLVLAANEHVAAGLLIQRLPIEGSANLSGSAQSDQDRAAQADEDFNRIAMLASTLKPLELLSLDAPTLLHRLFWEEDLRVFEPLTPRFACTCSRQRVATMLRQLGREEIDSILEERETVEVGCEFCGQKQHFDRIDAQALFTPGIDHPPGTTRVQ
jgi:molecular chaperone Hsp33